MLTVTIEGLEELRGEWAAACNALSRDIAEAVDDAAKAGRGAARNSAPVQTGKLSNSIDGGVTSRGEMSATGEVRATASYASFVSGGTKPHTIRARRKSALRFEQGGAVRFAKSVQHPGTAANPYWTEAVRVAETAMQSYAARAVARFCSRLSR